MLKFGLFPKLLASTVALVALVGAAMANPGDVIEKKTGVWVEGPGFEITYGGTYEVCAQRCLGNLKCVMIEYYRPEKKCNFYAAARPHKAGGSSFVGTRRVKVSDGASAMPQ